MKKFVFIIVLVCTAFVSFAKGVVRTTTTDLSLRVDASASSRVILTIPQGTQVYLQEDCDCVWVYVTYNGYCGYVNAQFLTTIWIKIVMNVIIIFNIFTKNVLLLILVISFMHSLIT